MALQTPDMDDCTCKKAKCLGGANKGDVYDPCKPCPDDQEFDQAQCDCVTRRYRAVAVFNYYWGTFSSGNAVVGCNTEREIDVTCQSGQSWQALGSESWDSNSSAGFRIETTTAFINFQNTTCGFNETFIVTTYTIINNDTGLGHGSVSDYRNVSASGFQKWEIEKYEVSGDTEAELLAERIAAQQKIDSSLPQGCTGSQGTTIKNYI